MKFLDFTTRLWKDEEGATAIEYGLLAALVAVALITVLGTMSGELEATFENVESSLAGANGDGGGGDGGGGGDPAPVD